MSAFDRLLTATIDHLEDLRNQGVGFVSLSPRTVDELFRRPAVSNASPSLSSNPPMPPRSPSSPVVARRSDPPADPVVSAPSPAIILPAAGGTLPPPLAPAAKEAAFLALQKRALACTRCPHLASSRKNVVFGVGTPDARLLLVGEAPGADEDEQGEPFVGKAGQLLTKIIQAMGLDRNQVYIANILKCRPDTPGQSAGNRKPTSEEMATCIPFLHEQIDLIRPEVMVALGATAVEGLLGKTSVGVTRLRGHWQTYRGIPLMPTYHPAYLLRNQAPSEKRKVWEDMMTVMTRLKMPISEKQQGYFLTK